VDRSKIEWTDATWNPVTGCTKVSQGCKNCYAERQWPRLSTGRPFTEVRCHADRLDIPLHWRVRKPRRVFVNSMSDLFHEDVLDDFIAAVFHRMALAPWHVYQILTKRPQRMLNFMHTFSSPPQHVWLGVSVEDQATADKRIPLLLQTPAAVRFISAEPLLGPVDLGRYMSRAQYNEWAYAGGPDECPHGYAAGIPCPLCPHLNWIICGGESGPRARPMHPDWARSLRDQCHAAAVPFFFKQWGEYAPACAQYPGTDAEHDETESHSCYGDICISNDAYIWEDGVQPSVNGRPWLMDRVGKKKAGRLLDGVMHDEYPERGIE